MDRGKILVEGRNCWRIVPARRAAFLVDAASYYNAFAAALERARSSILIVGWDMDSRIALVRDKETGKFSAKLGSYLNEVVSRRRGVSAHILVWDYAMIYALEREILPVLKFEWRTHKRLHFRLDSNHPSGASQHQKIVVIDDSLAFVGGLDLTKCRWDTPSHRAGDLRRFDPGCGFYSPFHDVQMAVDGKAARALARIVRERWRRATGQVLKPPRLKDGGTDPWPPDLTPDVENVLIAVSRTEPRYLGYPEVREVEALYIDAIRAARRYIYIENQYLTSSKICEVLGQRLRGPEGPEVVLILPARSSGWLEEATMDALRARILRRLHESDRFGRLRVYYPVLSGGGGEVLNVHSKVLVADDTLLRIGSSNLSNRSMGLDTECDLSIEASGEARVERAVAGFRNRLLGEHLGVSPERVGEMIEEKGSLIESIEALRSNGRTLEPMDCAREPAAEAWFAEAVLIDPDHPSHPSELIEEFVPDEIRSSSSRHLLAGSVIILSLVAAAALWHWTPLREWWDIKTVLYWGKYISDNPAAPLLVMGAYIAGGLVFFPVTILIMATALVFSPLVAFSYSLLGCLASACVFFMLGHVLGRETVHRFSGPRLKRLNERLGRRGFLTVLAVRIIPVAPFSLVNLMAGTSDIRFNDFVLGTLLGMAPGLFTITVFGEGLEGVIRDPGVGKLLFLAVLAALIIFTNSLVRWRLTRASRTEASKTFPESSKND